MLVKTYKGMRLFKREVTSMRKFFILFTAVLIASCTSTLPLKKIKLDKPENIEITTLSGNYNIEQFHTKSKIKVFESLKGEKGKSVEKATEEKIEEGKFKLHRSVLDVDSGKKIQYKHWVTDLKGKAELTSMGFPPVGSALFSIISNKAEVLAVKGVPLETIFYVPRIPLPKKAVKVGDSWDFSKSWRSLKTGWPFTVNLKVTHKGWYNCGGLNCINISYKGSVVLPPENPVSKGSLKSELSGEFVYAPVGDQFLWSSSKNIEVFKDEGKRVQVNSCVSSYQLQPDKTSDRFSSRFKSFCS